MGQGTRDQCLWRLVLTFFVINCCLLTKFKIHTVFKMIIEIAEVCVALWVVVNVLLHTCTFSLFLQAKVNNASLVGIGYTQTLRPGENHLQSNIQLLKTQWTAFSLTLHYKPVYFRYETNPLCAGGWEEYQCWWSQTGSGSGVGGMRGLLCHFIRRRAILAESDPERVWSTTDILKR